MANFVEHADGRICGLVEVNDPIGDTLRIYAENPRFIEYDGVVDYATHYVKDGRVVERPSMPLSVSGALISGIPAGSVLTLGEQTFTVDDGEAEIEGYSGSVKITCWPYIDAEVLL
ncbi:MAG: hypothetical protein EOM03_18800 [Clostridia bacterium]|nr:hypothetical protein [Clostridia bacterium]